MQHFCDPLLCYLGFLVAIFNIQLNCSVDVVLPRPLAVIKVVFISQQSLRTRVLSEQVAFLKITQVLTYLLKYNINMLSLKILHYRTFHYHMHTFF